MKASLHARTRKLWHQHSNIENCGGTCPIRLLPGYSAGPFLSYECALARNYYLKFDVSGEFAQKWVVNDIFTTLIHIIPHIPSTPVQNCGFPWTTKCRYKLSKTAEIYSSHRAHELLEVLRENGGSCRTAELAGLLNVSEETVRRSIKHLAKEGVVIKVHGGVLLANRNEEPTCRKP